MDSLGNEMKRHAGWTAESNGQGATKMDTAMRTKLETLVQESLADGLVPGLSVVILNRDGTL